MRNGAMGYCGTVVCPYMYYAQGLNVYILQIMAKCVYNMSFII